MAVTLTQQAAADELGVSLSFFKEHVLHELKVIRRGRRTLIPRASLEEWIAREAQAV